MKSTSYGLTGIVILGSLAAFAACSGDDSTSGDAGSDAPGDVGGGDASDAGADAPADTTVNDGTIPPDAADAADAQDAADALDGGSDAQDASDAADAADAAEAGIACSALTGLDRIYYSRNPILLPDGGTQTDGEMWVVKADGTSDTKIGAGVHPRLSPDGQHILFLRDNVNFYQANLYVRDLSTDGGAPVDHLVFTNTDSLLGFDWRADSQGIVFDFHCDIYSANRDGSNLQILINYREADCYSDYPVSSPPDGRIAWHNFYDGLGLSAADGGGAAHIPNTLPGAPYPTDGGVFPAADMYPAWAPDGGWLAFLAIPPVSQFLPGTRGTPYKIKPDGTLRTGLTPGLAAGDGFFPGGVISPDGTLYITAGIYQGVQGMYAVPLDASGAIKRVCTTPGAPVDFVGSAVP